MAEEKKVTISRSLNGDTIYYIARNSSGQVFSRELTLEKLQEAIKKYKEPPPVKQEEEVPAEPEEKKFLTNKLSGKVQKRKKELETAETAPVEEPQEEETKKLLENELKTKVWEKKEQSKKKSFWDKLK